MLEIVGVVLILIPIAYFFVRKETIIEPLTSLITACKSVIDSGVLPYDFLNTFVINAAKVIGPLFMTSFWMLFIADPLYTFLEKYVLKGYVIEDCGDVIRLHGSFRILWANKAYRDLLSVKPGFKIHHDLLGEYGEKGGLIAIRATSDEIKSKEELLTKVFEVKKIS